MVNNPTILFLFCFHNHHRESLENTFLGDAGAAALANGLSNSAARLLTTLSLCNSSIGSAGVEALVEALCTLGTMHTIVLSANPIGIAGVVALAKMISTTPTMAISTLALRSCGFGSAAMKILAGALNANNSISTLDLHGNNLGPEGAMALSLASVLYNTSSIAVFDIGATIHNLLSRGDRTDYFAAAAAQCEYHHHQPPGQHFGDSGALKLATALEKKLRRHPYI